jgi:hypothetical protein
VSTPDTNPPPYEVRTYGYLTAGLWDTAAGAWTEHVNLPFPDARRLAGWLNSEARGDQRRAACPLTARFPRHFPGVLQGCTCTPPANPVPAREYEPGYDAEAELGGWMNELRSNRKPG